MVNLKGQIKDQTSSKLRAGKVEPEISGAYILDIGGEYFGQSSLFLPPHLPHFFLHFLLYLLIYSTPGGENIYPCLTSKKLPNLFTCEVYPQIKKSEFGLSVAVLTNLILKYFYANKC